MKKKYTKILSLTLLSLMVFMGCDSTSTKSDTSNDELTIATSFYPLYVSTLNIIKDIPGVNLINMTQPQTGCLHDYQLTPQDLKTLSKSKIFVINGAGMEGFLDKVIANEKDLKVVNSTNGIELLSSDGAEHTHKEEDLHNDEDHNHSDNPHVWVSISKNIDQVKNIANGLSEYDPLHADQYQANATEYITKLEALKKEMHETIDALTNRNIITFHEAFPYFAEEFNLNIAAVVELEPGTEPSPKELEEIIELAKDNNVKALFTEPQYNAKSANTIAKEANISLYTLDPIVTGDSVPSAYDDYINKMKENLEILKEALK